MPARLLIVRQERNQADLSPAAAGKQQTRSGVLLLPGQAGPRRYWQDPGRFCTAGKCPPHNAATCQGKA